MTRIHRHVPAQNQTTPATGTSAPKAHAGKKAHGKHAKHAHAGKAAGRPEGNGQNAASVKANDTKPTPTQRQARPAQLEGSFASEQRRINDGVANGSLTGAEAQQLQAKLDDLHARFEKDAFQSADSKPKLGGLRRELRSLESATTAAEKNDDVDVNQLSKRLDQRLAAGQASGTLTDAEASALTQKATALKAELAQATTPDAMKAVGKKLAALNGEIGAASRNGTFDAAKRKSDFEARITAGLADGSLTTQEATALRSQLGRLDATKPEGWNRLDRNIFAQRHDRQVNVSVMGASLEGKVAALENAGRISLSQAVALRNDLTQAMAPGAAAAGARLNELRERLDAWV